MRTFFFGSLVVLAANSTLVLSDEPRPSGLASPYGAAAAANDQPTPPLPMPSPPLPEGNTPPGFANESSSRGGDRFWCSAEFLLWGIKDGNIPPLVTAGTPASGGVIGVPGTTILLGGALDYNPILGARFTIGSWLNGDSTRGVEFSYLFLDGSAGFNTSSPGAPGTPVLARPFINVITGLPDAEIVAFPGVVAGTVVISSGSNLQGAETNMIFNLGCHANCCDTCCGYQSGNRVDVLVGARYLNLNENLTITETLTFLPTAPPPFVPGSTITVTDQFETFNYFYGIQVGARAQWWRDRWFVNLLGILAFGDTHQEVIINGSTVFTDPAGVSIRQPGGFLALPTNIGDRSRDAFTVVPEIRFNVGYQLTNHLRAFVGYSFLYWSSVVRPGDQIDFVVNPTQLPSVGGPGILVGPARPAPMFGTTGFWAQGINFGMECRW